LILKVIVLTSIRKDIASRALPILSASQDIEIVGVILSDGMTFQKKKLVKRKVRKIFRIGLLGALNGIRIRSWYKDYEAADIVLVCQKLNAVL